MTERATPMADYPTALAEFKTAFAGETPTSRTLGIAHPNMLTPDVLGHFTTPSGRVVEISTGVFLEDRLFGVTVRPDPGVVSSSGREIIWESKMVEDAAEAHEHFRTLA